MAGSVVGHGISNAMFGGNNQQAAAPVAGAAPAAGLPPPAPCMFETQQFLQCMTQTGDQMDYCKGVFDQFKMCQVSAAQPMQQQQQM